MLRVRETQVGRADQDVAHDGLPGQSSLRASAHNCSISADGTGRSISAGRSARGVAASSARV
jgi:hypothetical protein